MTTILPISRIPVTPKPAAVPSLWNLIYDEIDNRLALLNAGKQDIGTGADQYFSSSGYQKLPSGLIIQWGSDSFVGAADTIQSKSFPLAFPNGAFVVVGSVGVILRDQTFGFQAKSAAQYDVGYHSESILTTSDAGYSWIAIGH